MSPAKPLMNQMDKPLTSLSTYKQLAISVLSRGADRDREHAGQEEGAPAQGGEGAD
jgi:hypothetical protein